MAHKNVTQISQHALAQESLLNPIVNRIRQSLELQEILTTAVLEVRSFLGMDRVKIYRFAPDGSGEVIAESIDGNNLPSLLGLHFPAGDIPLHAREMFVKARQRVIMDVNSQRKTINQLDCPDTGESLAIEDIRYYPADPCHLEYLSNMGVSSSLTIPILHQNQLWGLLACHHAESHLFLEKELKIVQMLVDQVSIAIAQSNLLSQARQQARHEATLNQISSLLHSPLNIVEIQQTVLEETVKALNGSGGRLYLIAPGSGQPAQLYTYGEQPTLAELEESPIWQQMISSVKDSFPECNDSHREQSEAWKPAARLPLRSQADNDDERYLTDKNSVPLPYTISDLYQEPAFEALVPGFQSTLIRSILIVPLQDRQQCMGYLSVFRNEIDTETLWAGRWNDDERNLYPRASFAALREIKTGQTQTWTQEEIKLAQSLGTHLYMAVMQRCREEMIRHQASHDLLTGLPNRVLFNERIFLALANAHQRGEILAVVFIDLDRFKTINDTLGHAVGDQLLQKAAARVRGCLRKVDTLARWGGDEFTLLLPQISCAEDAAKVAQRILDAFSAPFYFKEQELHITTSIGMVLAPYGGEDAATLLKNADTAMYYAKQQGKNNYQFYAPTMNNKALEQLVLENNLHKALYREEFLLHYQPQVDLNTGQIVGMEALVRWQHPELGLVPPNQFIPLAEETGLIVPIGEWTLRTACAQNQAWQLAGLPPLRIAVNLSARQFQKQNLIKTITQVLKETGLEPRYLELEITESLVMQDVDFTVSILRELQDMGIYISMDDFGTGYSSLSSLMCFPLHTLKIDQSFIRNLTTNPANAAIITSVITLGHGLNLKVIAEGVETLEQLEFLRSAKCDFIQGYLFSQPLSAEAATQFMIKQVPLTRLAANISVVLGKNDKLLVLLQQCTESLVRDLDVACARIWMLNEAENVLELEASTGMFTDLDGPHHRVPVGKFQIGRIAQNCQPLLTHTVLDDSDSSNKEGVKREGVVAIAGYPLIVESSLVGVMAMFARKPLEKSVIAQLTPIAAKIAQCIQHKQTEELLRQQTQRERLVAEIAQRIRQSVDLEQILNIIVTEVRQLLQADRVLIYRLWLDGTGSGVKESVISGYPAVLGQMFPEEVFPQECRQLYCQGEARVIPDVENGDVSPCMVEFLQQFAVKSKLVVPILQKEELWGLMVVHQCSGPRHWQPLEISLLNQLATHAAIAIQQSELYAQCIEQKRTEELLRQQTQREQLVAEIAQRIRQSLDLEEILNTTVEEVREFLQTDRVIVYRFKPDWNGVVAMESVAAGWTPILRTSIEEPCLKDSYAPYYKQGRVRAIEDIYTAGLGQCYIDLLAQFQVRANLVVPILQGKQLWGLLIAHQCSGPRHWQQHEISLLNQLATHAAIAIQQSELYRQLQHLASSDSLTQLANRRRFDEYLDREWQRLAREGAPLSLILCDIDFFKTYNDTYGHQAGDNCLQQVAKAISFAVKRPADLVARYGGEEFAVILPNTDAEGAVQIAEEIHSKIQVLQIAHASSQVSKYVTLSLGVVSTVPCHESSPAALIAAADKSLYQAKAEGRDRVCSEVPSSEGSVLNLRFKLKLLA